MKTIQRIYLYAVSLISMEVVLWGMIGLARSIFSDSSSGGVSQLSQALALILVGVPVFGIHWWAAQRSANQDEEERSSGVRALFLYAVLLGLLIPFSQNGLAVLNRLVTNLFNIPSSRALIGGYQSLSDNLIAALFNGFVAVYFLNILKKDWLEVSNKAALTLTRRIYRYIWVLYSLVMAIAGVNQILRYIFSLASIGGVYENALFANGLALTLVGIPLWVWAWKVVQDSLSDPAEKASLLRLGILYFFSLAGVIFVLSTTGIVINEFFQMLFDRNTFAAFFIAIDEPLAIAIPLGAVWAYYGHWLQRDLAALPSAPRRAALHRFYYYILSAIGLVTAFIGLSMLLAFIVDAALATSVYKSNRLAESLATLFVGLPLWLFTWQPMQAKALSDDEDAEQARRSIIRKIYLYLAIFAGVVGGMVAAVQLISLLFEALLGSLPNNFTRDLLNSLQMLILFGGLLTYHWQSLRRDGLLRSEIKGKKVDAISVLLLDTENGTLSNQLASLIGADDAEINLIPQNPTEEFPTADAAILPQSLLLDAPEMLRERIRQFNGSKLIITDEADDYFVMENVAQIKKSLLQLAEGEEIQRAKKSPGWMIAVYILAGMMALQILFFL
ncbi:MAG: hypothetical protein HN390_00015 [Anaerolineae bacterium]|jgi:hypothetical protein|nr:hypothetical protein [Anaerolineae bacterium]MBT7073977.1 hypothetical protein [Anaerolineae bacterium]MBT7991753.1 hypothetical protein [Anaerolineae bacterium]